MINPNTNKWLMWRKEGIGSADAPIIMGMSPWSTPYKLYLDKIGEAVIDEKEEASKRYIFEKGHQVESIARSQIEIENGVFYPPILYQMENFPWLRCSMDGANESLMEGKEFKLVSKKEFDDGVCPPKYIPQVQHQYMVSGYKKIDVVLCLEVKKKGILTKEAIVPMDYCYIQTLARKEAEFWWHVINRIPPALTKGDAVRIKDKEIIKKIKEQKEIDKKIQALKIQLTNLGMRYDQSCMDVQDYMTNNDIKLMYYQKKMYRNVETIQRQVRVECY